MVTLAQRLEKMRMAKGISRVELASVLGLPRLSIEKFETGKLTPTKEQQENLASYFNVSVANQKCESDDPNEMQSWLNGNIREEPGTTAPEAPAPRAAKPKPADLEDGAIFKLLLRSEAFHDAVLDVLNTPEGQRVLVQAVRRAINRQ